MNISNAQVEKTIEECFANYLKNMSSNRSMPVLNLPYADQVDYYYAWGVLRTLLDLQLIDAAKYMELQRDLDNRKLAAQGLAS